MNGYKGPVIPAAKNPAQQSGSRLVVPQKYANSAKLPFQPAVGDRSLQINIDSADDAKSVIQNLGMIRDAYKAADVTSVEFLIAESVADQVDPILRGAINWCRTYVKRVAPNPGNVLFPLPSYRELVPVPKPATQTHVKPQRPVHAPAGAS